MAKNMYIHTELIKLKCTCCGRDFERYNSQKLLSCNNYCSLECEYNYECRWSKYRKYSYEFKYILLEFSIENENKSTRQIAKIFGCSKDMVTNIIKKYGNRKPKKLINFNRDYFKKIDTEEKAYFFGFIMADGCVSKSGSYNLDITLKKSDENHLIKFSKAINYEGTIKTRKIKLGDKIHLASRITLSSEDMCKDLIKLGCGINKTFNLELPSYNKVPKHLMRHLIRGVWDGDGCIGHYKYKKCISKKWQVSIMGTKDLLEGISKFLYEEIGDTFGETTLLYKDKRLNNEITKTFYKHGKRAEEVIKYLYKNCNFYLDRKYDLYKKLLKGGD